ncbi:peptidyl-tRNA hydrolase [Spirochaetia bacterium]|nr:peptidyl-tRNA hydrolase [Spirochaetia bacterium]
MIELVAFLGNPGDNYARNRHNAGRLLAEKLPFYSALSWQNKYKGLYAALDSVRLLPYLSTASTDATSCDAPPANLPPRLHFIMPETFMNLSGDSIHAAASFFKIPPDRILLVHDELELPLGTASFKFSGGLGGHNGLRSMKANLGTADFWRLRIGIGRPDPADQRSGDIAAWVLSDFARSEEAALEQVLAICADALVCALLRGAQTLLPEWNKKKLAG